MSAISSSDVPNLCAVLLALSAYVLWQIEAMRGRLEDTGADRPSDREKGWLKVRIVVGVLVDLIFLILLVLVLLYWVMPDRWNPEAFTVRWVWAFVGTVAFAVLFYVAAWGVYYWDKAGRQDSKYFALASAIGLIAILLSMLLLFVPALKK